MSVPYGFRFVTDDLGDVHRLMMAHRAVIEERSYRAKGLYLARRATRNLDVAALDGQPCVAPLSTAYDTLAERIRAHARGNPDPEIDHAYAVSILPWEGRVYGAIHTWQGAWAADLIRSPGIEPFDYTDSTDQHDVPKAEYDARRDVWNGISSQDPGTRLSGCGFQVTFHPSHRTMPAEDILALVPDRAERAWRRARDRVVIARMQAIDPEGADAMRSGIKAAMWFADDEGQAAARAEAQAITPLLPQITLDVLRHGLGA